MGLSVVSSWEKLGANFQEKVQELMLWVLKLVGSNPVRAPQEASSTGGSGFVTCRCGGVGKKGSSPIHHTSCTHPVHRGIYILSIYTLLEIWN